MTNRETAQNIINLIDNKRLNTDKLFICVVTYKVLTELRKILNILVGEVTYRDFIFVINPSNLVREFYLIEVNEVGKHDMNTTIKKIEQITFVLEE